MSEMVARTGWPCFPNTSQKAAGQAANSGWMPKDLNRSRIFGLLPPGRAMPDLPSALYFSAVTYTTTGYGDLVLPQVWRLVGAIEALTGILMCGWSTGFFFAVVNRILEARSSNA